MKRILGIMLILCMMCHGGGVFDWLCAFRDELVHIPGQYAIRSVTQIVADGGGNCLELSLTFQQIMQDEGIPCRLMTGIVAMKSEQLQTWLPELESAFALGIELADDGCWHVPMVWVQCRTHYVPHLFGRGVGDLWIDVFPGLIGADTLVDSYEASSCLSHHDGVAGYRSREAQSLAPVRIIEASVLTDIPDVTITITMLHDGKEVFDVQGIARETDSRSFDLAWQQETVGYRPVLTLNGVTQEAPVMPVGDRMTVRVSLWCNGDCIDIAEDILTVGEHASYVWGNSMEADGSAEQMACRVLHERLWRQERLTDIVLGDRPTGELLLTRLSRRCGEAETVRVWSGGRNLGTRGRVIAAELGRVRVMEEWLHDCGCQRISSLLQTHLDGGNWNLSWQEDSNRLDGNWKDRDGDVHDMREVVGTMENLVLTSLNGFAEGDLLPLTEAWAKRLELLGTVAETSELNHLDCFGKADGARLSRPVWQALTLIHQQAVANVSGRVDVAVSQAESWQVQLVKSDGTVVVEWNGEQETAVLPWNGADMDGGICPDGDYWLYGVAERNGLKAFCLMACQWRVPTLEEVIEDDQMVLSITSPADSTTVTEGLVTVCGTAVGSHEDTFRYRLQVRNKEGQLIKCQEHAKTPEWQLSYFGSHDDSTHIAIMYPEQQGTVLDGQLGVLDVSGLPNGNYTLELIGVNGVCSRSVSCLFRLNSELKLGEVRFSELDGTVRVNGMKLNLMRSYSSFDGLSDCGWGWHRHQDSMKAELSESRMELESIDGTTVSVRTGGSRDVTLTLPDSGKPCTFAFSLVSKGGWSYAYQGRWTAPSRCKWQLRASVSSDVVALPGLEPYWEAAGPESTLEAFDFPGYVLTSPDGTEYHVARESLGQYAAIDEENGGSVLTDCYGSLNLAAIIFTDGSKLLMTDRSYVWQQRDGTSYALLELERNEQGLVTQLRFKDGSGTIIQYAYTEDGRLVSVSVGNGQVMTPRRFYHYECPEYPQRLTQVTDGFGHELTAFTLDDRGLLTESRNGQGAVTARKADAFAQIEAVTDCFGHTTVYRYDKCGHVVSIQHPDGGEDTYVYDDSGRCTSQTDALGRTVSFGYDEAGLLMCRTDEAGGRYEYQRDSNGACTRVIRPDGSWQTLEQGEGGKSLVTTASDGSVTRMTSSKDGKCVTMTTFDGSEINIDYDDDGKPVRLNDGSGVSIERSQTELNGVTTTICRWVNNHTGEVEEWSAETYADNEGRLLAAYTVDGTYVELTRDDNGRVVVERDDKGHWTQIKRDVSGRVVEELNDEGLVRRFVYDQTGRVMLTAGPEMMDSWQDTLCFKRCEWKDYDCCGRLAGTSIGHDVVLELHEVGGGCYENKILERGDALQTEWRTYDACGQVIADRLSWRGVHTYEYDVLGRLVAETDSHGNRTELKRTVSGAVTERRTPDGGRTTFDYDSHGRHIRTVHPDEAEIMYDYDGNGCLAVLQPESLTAYSFHYNDRKQLTEVQRDKAITRYGYTEDGYLSSVENARGHKWRYELDHWGRMVGSTSPEGRLRSWSYPAAAVTYQTMTDGEGNREDVVMDETDVKRSWSYMAKGNREATLTFERESGDCLNMTAADGRQRREVILRDSLGHCIGVEVNGERMQSHSWDDSDRCVSYADSMCCFQQDYDGAGRVARRLYSRVHGQDLTEPQEIVYSYDVMGRLACVEYPDHWKRLQQYDVCGRLTTVEVWSENHLKYRSTCRYRRGGKKEAMTEYRWQNGTDMKREIQWEYDGLGRVIREQEIKDGGGYDWRWTYDAVGNIIGESRVTAEGIMTATHAYDRDNCLILSSYEGQGGTYVVNRTWNGNGALVHEKASGDRQWECSYDWNVAGRLQQVRHYDSLSDESYSVFYHYDNDWRLIGHQVERSQNDRLISKSDCEMIQETIMQGGLSCVMNWKETQNGQETCHTMLHASAPVDWETGEWIQEGNHTNCWGERLDVEEVRCGAGPWGEWSDGVSGLVFLRSRFYSPRLRQFISPDTVLGDIRRPETQNAYAYCHGDPVNLSDPQGTFAGLTMASFMSMNGFCFVVSSLALNHLFGYVRELNYLSMMVSYAMDSSERYKRNKTLFVHGVGPHSPGYAEDTINILESMGATNQDYDEFLWTGFNTPFIYTPALLLSWNHNVACSSLYWYLTITESLGYQTVNVISHSWGTMLSRDALNAWRHAVGTWVTMGSPLSAFEPQFTYREWLNCYYTDDPVDTSLFTFLNFRGYNDSTTPLWMSDKAEIKQIGQKFGTWGIAHTKYWTDSSVLVHIARSLMAQGQ